MDNFEITYTSRGDYYYPNLALPAQEQFTIGKYGLMRLDYLKKHRKGIYTMLVSECKLNQHLHEVDLQSQRIIKQTVTSMAKADSVDEKLKAENPMQWVGLMNNYKHSAEEFVLSEIIYQ